MDFGVQRVSALDRYWVGDERCDEGGLEVVFERVLCQIIGGVRFVDVVEVKGVWGSVGLAGR